MIKAYKVELDPTEEQKHIFNQWIGTCRYLYNLFLARKQEVYKQGGNLKSGAFDTWVTKEYIPNTPNTEWIKELPSTARNWIIRDCAEVAYKKFFDGKGKVGFPKFKKKKDMDTSVYFKRSNDYGKKKSVDKVDTMTCERHRIKLAKVGWVRIKRKGYAPDTKGKPYVMKGEPYIKSGVLSYKAGRYYIALTVEQQEVHYPTPTNEGIGIDLGIKDFAICSNGTTFKNINKTQRVKKLEKSLKRQQRRLSRKDKMNKKKGENFQRCNIKKQVLKIQKINQTLTNIRDYYVSQTVAEIVKTKPSYVTIEDLNVIGMMKNKHLSKAIAQQKFSDFRTKLVDKCKTHKIEVRLVDRWFPSSKTCSRCGAIKKDLKLSDRTYKCECCGLVIDRDYNASINLKNATVFTHPKDR